MTVNSKQSLAIVGIGCRFPGGAISAEHFWNMVSEGTDAICDVPLDRWDYRKFFDASDRRPGKTRVKQGGYLQQPLNQFDPLFFGISPREAAFIDPQQRILLEVAWEAFEDAGLTQQKLQGSNTGVFIGAFNLDNLLLQLGRDNLESISSSTAASVTMTMLSNRLSYTFDLKGPSVTMDTACSSSMVSTHYACQSIWSGDCDMALAGGVNIISRPEYMVSMSKGGFLSAHGRCKSFDKDANGYARGEGAGIIIIKTLQQAIADNDNIYVLIRNTGVNQDGHTQNGISFPDADAQRELIRKVYAEANIAPLDVSYVEAHGTGTQAGDPIEIASIAAVLAEGRSSDSPCYVGSVKSNIGHTESAAGVAGIIKASLSIKKGVILPNLHFNNPNPNIDFANGRIVVPVKQIPWRESGKPRIASVNSFGYGGTNGHIVLQEYVAAKNSVINAAENSVANNHVPYLIPVSAKTRNSLAAQCQKLHDFLTSEAGAAVCLADLTYSLACRRSALSERLALVVHDKQELLQKLTAVIHGEFPEGSAQQSVDVEGARRMVFVFTGMGPQWWGMGRELYATEPVFKQKIDECDEVFLDIADWSIKTELLAEETESQMTRTPIAQPANFVIQVALLELYRSWGITPAAVVGHSVGEVAAAYASGALSLEDALLVTLHRSRLQQNMAGKGAMLAIGIGGENARELADLYDLVSVAAINSATSVTLAGDPAQLEEISRLLETQGIFNRMLQVEVAYHSYQMDPIETDLRAALENIHPQVETVLLYSTVTGKQIKGTALDAQYWWQNVRQPVSFEPAIKQLIDDGYVHFLEVGPHPVTRNFLSECLADKKVQGRVFSSLVRKKAEQQIILESLGQIFTAGYSLIWPESIQSADFVRLPSYPWQREIYWNESQLSHQYLLGSGEKHPYFYEKLMTPEPAWQVELNENFFPFLPDHKISNRVVFPGAGYIEAGLALQFYHKERTGVYSLENLKFHRMLMLNADKAQQLRVVEHRDKNAFSIYASEINSNNWTLHASGQLVGAALKRVQPARDLADLKVRCQNTLNRNDLYSAFNQRGLEYGPQFQTISEIYIGDNCVLAKISNQAMERDRELNSYQIYPTLLDGAFQSLIALAESYGSAPMVPVEVGEVTVYQTPAHELWCYGELVEQTSSSMTCHVQLLDEHGCLLVELVDLICMEIAVDSDTQADEKLENCFYQYDWVMSEISAAGSAAEGGSKNSDNWIFMLQPNNKEDVEALMALLRKCKAKGIVPQIIDLTKLLQDPEQQEIISDDDLAALRLLLEQKLKPGHNQLMYVCGGITPSPAGNPTLHSVMNPCLPLIALAQSLEIPVTPHGHAVKASADLRVNLTLVTRGAQQVDAMDTIDASLSAVAALAHLLGNEVAVIKPRHVDLPLHTNEHEWDTLISELLCNQHEEDIALRDERRLVKKLREINLDSGERIFFQQVAANNQDYTINIDFITGKTPGFKFSLSNVPVPQHDQLHIQFEKLLIDDAMFNTIVSGRGGKMDPSAQLRIGLGTVIACGSSVKLYKPGHQVIVLLTDLPLSSQILIQPNLCFQRDPELAPEFVLDYVAYASALYLLEHIVGDIGEKIFIQDAFCPIGLALAQLALLNGTTVYATADSAFKRDYLYAMGAQYVFDNCELTYITDIQNLIGQEGFKVVINSLGNEHFTHCFKLLCPGGQLIQTPVPSGQFLRFFSQTQKLGNYHFAFVDLMQTLRDNPEVLTRARLRLKALFAAGSLRLFPKASIPVAEIALLDDYFASAESFPQSVLEFDSLPVEVLHRESVSTLNRAATYLITGGTSGLGLEIARWLIEQGVQSLVLVSRSGSSRPEAQTFIQTMQATGKNVQAFAVDITDGKAVNTLVENISNSMSPLKGIIHCAMVLDDDLAINMNSARMTQVLAPKISGALNLHNATRHLILEQFISISSISSIIGNSGQFNYVAANAFLDGFAYFRRQAGLAGTTINLGVLQNIGVVARDTNLANMLDAKGIRGLATEEVLRGLGYILNQNPAQLGFFRVDWSTWALESPKGAASSRFIELVQKSRTDHDMSPALVNLLKLLEDQEHYFARLMDILSVELAEIVKIPVSEIKLDRSISELGIDSLMSVELSRGLRAKYGLEITSMELLSGPSLDQLTENLVAQLTEKI